MNRPVTLREQLAISAHIDDLDEAVGKIQEIISVTDGGPASHFFSGPNEDAWPDASLAWRHSILCHYVAYEMALLA